MTVVAKRTACALGRLRTDALQFAEHVRDVARQARGGPSEGWTTLILFLICTIVSVGSLGDGLVVPPGFYGMALVGAVFALVMAKARWNGWLLGVGGFFIGVGLSIWLASGLVDGPTIVGRLTAVGVRLFIWVRSFLGGGTSTDMLPFSLFLLLTSWLIGFYGSWWLFRKRSVWGALLPGTIALVAGLTSLLPGGRMSYLYLYLSAAMLLAAHLSTLERDSDYRRRGIRLHLRDMRLPLGDAFRLALAVTLVTSLLPLQGGRIEPLASAWDRVVSEARAMGQDFAGAFGGAPVEEPYSEHAFGPSRSFTGAAALSDVPVLMMTTPPPMYLPARSYGVYTHEGWETGHTRMASPELTPAYAKEVGFSKMREVELNMARMLPLRPDGVLLVGGYPLEVGVDYQMEVLRSSRYRIFLGTRQQYTMVEPVSLPPDLEQAVRQLREMTETRGERPTEEEIRAYLPSDVRIASWEYDGEGVRAIVVERRSPIPLDVVSVRNTDRLAAGETYRAMVLVSTATATDLRAAETEYPGWVLDSYLQLPDDMPSRVIDLAGELTADADNPYEKAIAIRDYLRTFEYALDIDGPPEGADGVDYFLFELQRGYCFYFASAMAVLLRASGVPARLVSGYARGEMISMDWPDGVVGSLPDEWRRRQQLFVVSNSHSWPEVFFPEYGWITFEPTPGYSAAGRDAAPLPPGRIDQGIIGSPGAPDPGPPPGGPEGVLPGEAEDRGSGLPWRLWLPVTVVGLAVLAMVGRLLWRRMLGEVMEPRVAYARMGHLAALSGLAPAESSTPHEFGRRLGVALPDVSADLDKIVSIYTRVRYGQRSISEEDRCSVADAWPRVRNRLLSSALRRLALTKLLWNRQGPR